MTSTKFEEIMSKHNMHEKDEFKSIKSLNIFYQVKHYFEARVYWQINGLMSQDYLNP